MKKLAPFCTKSIKATIPIPGSKSITNRALILAALAKGKSHLSNIQISDDSLTLVRALQTLGIDLEIDTSLATCTIQGCDGKFPKTIANIWCQDAGTIARFLLAACAIMPGEYHFDASTRLRERPLAPLLDALVKQGASIVPASTNSLPLSIKGGTINGGNITLNASLSSQLASALLMIAPYAKNPTTLTLEYLVSEPYIDLTIAVMKAFGAYAEQLSPGKYKIPHRQHYRATNYHIEPDYSTASYFFAAAALTGGEVNIPTNDTHHIIQGDIGFLNALSSMGCHITKQHGYINVKGPTQLNGIEIDMGNISDTFMTLAAIAGFAKTPTRIYNIAHARLKESDRIAAMESELKKLNIQVESGHDWIMIHPSTPRGTIINPHNDHRIAMSCTLVGLKTKQVVIDQAECVSKTCPHFFELWQSMLE